jgi:hypothetical protein
MDMKKQFSGQQNNSLLKDGQAGIAVNTLAAATGGIRSCVISANSILGGADN